MVEQGGAQASPTETGAEGGGEGLSSGQPPEAEGVERESECGVWCVVWGKVWICTITYCVGVSFYTLVKNYNFRIRYMVECAYLPHHGMDVG